MAPPTTPDDRRFPYRISHHFLRKKKPAVPPATTSTSATTDTGEANANPNTHRKQYSFARLFSSLNLRKKKKNPLQRTGSAPPLSPCEAQSCAVKGGDISQQPALSRPPSSPETPRDNITKLGVDKGKGKAQNQDYILPVIRDTGFYGGGWDDGSMQATTDAMLGVPRRMLHSEMAEASSNSGPANSLSYPSSWNKNINTIDPIMEEVEEEEPAVASRYSTSAVGRMSVEAVGRAAVQVTATLVMVDTQVEGMAAEIVGTPTEATIEAEAGEEDVGESTDTASLKTPVTSELFVPGAWVD